MKICTKCNTKYDDSVEYCMNDGTKLVEQKHENAHSDEAKKQQDDEKARAREEGKKQAQYERMVEEREREKEEKEKSAKTRKIIAIAVIGTLIVFGIGFWMASSMFSDPTEDNNNTPTTEIDVTRPRVSSSPSATPTPLPTQVVIEEPRIEENTVNVQPPAVVKQDVGNEVEDWQTATETEKYDELADKYAPEVTYYGRKMKREDVIKERQKIAAQYETLDINRENMEVTPSSDGKSARVVFYREWDFVGDNKRDKGKAQTEMIFQNFNGRWLIVSQRDLKQYPSNEQ